MSAHNIGGNKMDKVLIGKASVSPAPTVIAGALVDGKANYLTLGGFGGMSITPPMVYITVNKAHYTNSGIKENGYFSVNLPSADMVPKTDYVGLVSGRDTDKSGVFTPFYGSVKGAPMIEECPVNMLCKVYKIIDLPNNEVFIGEIVETYINADCLNGKVPDMKKMNPLILGGGSYWSLGDIVGAAFKDGRVLIKK
jgi:flavin reductase (DIM6/NTAB) family NADH-FMN oxidoreductase RutF